MSSPEGKEFEGTMIAVPIEAALLMQRLMATGKWVHVSENCYAAQGTALYFKEGVARMTFVPYHADQYGDYFTSSPPDDTRTLASFYEDQGLGEVIALKRIPTKRRPQTARAALTAFLQELTRMGQPPYADRDLPVQ